MAQPTFMGQTVWFQRHLYDGRARGGTEDQDLLLRSFKNSHFANLPELLMGYRETRLSLKKILRARYFMSLNMARFFRSQGLPMQAARAVICQALKSAIDIFAITTGLDYTVLRHRALPISMEEQRNWLHVTESVGRVIK
jgi:hypothetical protein